MKRRLDFEVSSIAQCVLSLFHLFQSSNLYPTVKKSCFKINNLFLKKLTYMLSIIIYAKIWL